MPRRTKVGHAGTLDPFATGVLVVCVGPATRLAEYVQSQTKRYTAEITLGANSSTDDIEGEIAPRQLADSPPTEQQVLQVLKRYVGEIQQTPPAHSAVHVNGQRAYALARKGQQVELTPRTVTIHQIELLTYDYPKLRLDVSCGSGTYIRALARDVGETLGVGGYCSQLTRTEVGAFCIESAVAIDGLDPAHHLLDPMIALSGLPSAVASPAQAKLLANGNAIELPPDIDVEQVAVISQAGRLLAIVRVDAESHMLRPQKVFPA